MEAGRLHVIPETIDFSHFDPDATKPKELFPAGSGVEFVFLSVFKWEDRKNWRVRPLEARPRDGGCADLAPDDGQRAGMCRSPRPAT